MWDRKRQTPTNMNPPTRNKTQSYIIQLGTSKVPWRCAAEWWRMDDHMTTCTPRAKSQVQHSFFKQHASAYVVPLWLRAVVDGKLCGHVEVTRAEVISLAVQSLQYIQIQTLWLLFNRKPQTFLCMPVDIHVEINENEEFAELMRLTWKWFDLTQGRCQWGWLRLVDQRWKKHVFTLEKSILHL